MMSDKESSVAVGLAVAKTNEDIAPLPNIGVALAELKASDNPAETQLGKALIEWLEKNPVAVERIGAAVQNFGKFAQKIHSAVVTILEIGRTASAFIGQAIVEVHESYAARIDQYPNFLAMIPVLAQRGWFVSESLTLTQIDEVAVRARHSSVEDVEDLLFTLYGDHIEWLGEELVRLVPNKTFLILPAIAAHQRGEYAVSIPLFFILTDGVCFETVNRYVFQGKHEDEKLSSLAASKVAASTDDEEKNVIIGFYDTLSTAMWGALSARLPLAYSQKERDALKYSGLNRHTIMHGIAGVEYATKQNSLKAFSLLSHLAALTHRDEWSERLRTTINNENKR